MFQGQNARRMDKRPQSALGVLALALMLVVFAPGLPVHADAPLGCQVSAINPVSFVGTTPPCDGKLVISQADFDAVGSSARSQYTGSIQVDGNGEFKVTLNSQTYGVADWYTGNITNMSGYFYSTTIADGSDTDPIGRISAWDTSSATDMSHLFSHATSFNQDIGDWNVSNVTNMAHMFEDAAVFNQSLNWGTHTANVKDMSNLFHDADLFEGGGLEGWDTSSVETMERMFFYAKAFNGQIGNWDVGNVKNMEYLFGRTDLFNQSLNWDVSGVEDMSYVFYYAEAFNGDISGWNTGAVKYMQYMFRYAKNFNNDIGGWDVRSVTNMKYMLSKAESFHQDIGDWDVSSVTNMDSMFRSATSFNHDLSGWPVGYFSDEPDDFDLSATAWIEDYRPNWQGIDSTSPTVETFYPSTGDPRVDQDAVLVLTFSEGVEANSGSIEVLEEDGSNFAAIDVTSDAVEFSGPNMFLTLPSALGFGQTYYVTIASGVIQDISTQENPFAGFTDDQTWRFTVEASVDADKSQVVATPAGGNIPLGSTAIIQVVALDENDNPVSGQAADLAASLTNGAALGAFAETADGSGVYEAELTATQVGETEVSITINGVTLAQTATVTFVESLVVLTDVSSLTLDEGTSDTFNVSLETQPSDTVTVKIQSSDSAAVGVSVNGAGNADATAEVTFDPLTWNIAQAVTVEGVEDSDVNTEEDVGISFAVLLGSATEGFESQVPESFSVTVLDEEEAFVVPDAPENLSVTQGDGALQLTWTTPENDGGAPIEDYEVSVDGGLTFAPTGNTTPNATIAGLINGSTYDVQVRAVSTVGPGDPSDTITITPAAANAGSPYNSATCVPILASDDSLEVTVGTLEESDIAGAYSWSGTLTFTFSAPLDVVLAPHPSSTVSNFEDGALYQIDTGTWVQTLGSESVTYALNGTDLEGAESDADLANADWGHLYAAGVSTLTLRSRGNTGDAFAICHIPETPDPPTDLRVTPGDGELALSWTAPADQGAGITAYKYSLDGGKTYGVFQDTATSQTVSVANGAAYAVTVLAVNDQGDGDPSETVTVPSVTLEAASVSATVSSAFAVTATFSAPVTGFGDQADLIVLGNGSLAGDISQSDDGTVYTFEVQPSAGVEGEDVTVSVKAGAAILASDGRTGNTQVAEALAVAADTKGPVFSGQVDFVVEENTAEVGTLAATDGGGAVLYAISGGDDAGDFVIDASTGALSFDIDGVGGAADFDAPADADQNNEYRLQVSATDGLGNATDQAVTVMVTNLVEANALAVETADPVGGPDLDLLLQANALDLQEGVSGEVFLTLREQPSDAVTITVESEEAATALILVEQDGATTKVAQTEVTFNLATWATPQSIWIEAVDRDQELGDFSTAINLGFADSADAGYKALDALSFTVNAANTTVPGLAVSYAGASEGQNLKVDEADQATFDLVLTTKPSGDVKIGLATDAADPITVESQNDGGTTLTFSQNNWNVAQTVIVTGTEDADSFDHKNVEVQLVPEASGGYSADDAISVLVDISDIDAPGLDVTAVSATPIPEQGTATFTIKLHTQPSGDVTVTVQSGDGEAIGVSIDGGQSASQSVELIFTDASSGQVGHAWDEAQTVTLLGLDDDNAANEDVTITVSAAGGGYDGVEAAQFSVSVEDDDPADFVVNLSATNESGELVVGEGGTSTLSIELETPPTANVTVRVETDDPDVAGVSLAGQTAAEPFVELTFAAAAASGADGAWNTAQEVTVWGTVNGELLVDLGTVLNLAGSSDDASYDGTSGSVPVAVANTTAASLTVSETALTIAEAGSGSFTVVLNAEPTATVTVDVTSENPDAATVSPAFLTFTTSDWNTAQPVTVTGVDDANSDGESFNVILDPRDGGYDGVTTATVGFTMVDDDAPGLVISDVSTDLVVDEGTTGTFGVALATQPSASVTVTLESGDSSIAKVASAAAPTPAESLELTFTTSDWAISQVVTVTGVADTALADRRTDLTLEGAGASEYVGLTGTKGVAVTNTTAAGLSLSDAGSALVLDEDGEGTFTVQLTAQPTDTVTVSVTSSHTNVATVDGTDAELTFTSGDWNQAQDVRILGVTDTNLVLDTATITVTANGGGYSNVAATKSLEVKDVTVPSLTVSETELTIAEAGSGSFTVVLNAEPTATVTVDVTSKNKDAATVSPAFLTFTTSDWNTAQPVTVTGVDDANSDGESFNVILDPRDGGYDDGANATVVITMADDDIPGLVISDVSADLVVDEGTTGTFGVALATEPSGSVTVTLGSGDGSIAKIASAAAPTPAESLELTFTTLDWAISQVVTVTGVADTALADRRTDLTLEGAGASEYVGLTGTKGVAVTNTTAAGLSLSDAGSALVLDEDGEGTFTVQLTAQPTDTVTVTVASSDTNVATVDGDDAELTFTSGDWDQAQDVRILGVTDTNLALETATITVTANGGGYSNVAATKSLEVNDVTVPSLTVSETALTIGEASSGSFTVVLDAEPTATVTVDVTSENTDAATASPAFLTFTTSNWNTAQPVTVTGVDDANVDNETFNVTLDPRDGGYDGVATATVGLTITDDDIPGLVISDVSADLVVDEGTTGTFGVALATQPSASVTVTLESGDSSIAKVESAAAPTPAESLELTFTPSDWAISQVVTVTGVADTALADRRTDLTLEGAGASEYVGLTGTKGVAVTNTTAAGLSLSDAGSALVLDEDGEGTFTVQLTAQPTDTVTVAVASSDTDVATVDGDDAELTFTSGDWDQAQGVRILGVTDTNLVLDRATITVTANGGGYSNVAATKSLEVKDVTVPSLTVSETALTIDEADSDTFTVVLGAPPTADVTVTVTSDKVGTASVSKNDGATQGSFEDLIFTTANWNFEQTVTVTAVDNSGLGAGAATLTLSTSSADTAYDALADQSLAVTIADDESVTLVTSASTLTLDEGGTATFTLALGGSPSGEVTVTPGSSNANALTVAETSLTFDDSNWNVAQTVTLTAPENSSSGDVTVEVNLVAAGAEFAGVSGSVRVTIEDNDRQIPAEDTGALVSSIATSEVMGSQLGNLISDAITGGIAATNPTNDVPVRMRRTLYGYTATDYDPEAYNRLQVLSAREGANGFTLVDWFSAGLLQASLDASLSGDGVFAYALAGRELTKTSASVSGLLYGVETSSWDYDEETDVDRTGFSLGYYSAESISGLTFSGSAIFTLSQNDFVSESGATGDANSQRLIFKGSISGERELDRRRGLLKPYVNLMYATEDLAAFTFSDGTSSDDSATQIGRFGFGLEYTTVPDTSGNRFLVRGELSQVFGTDTIRLSDGEVYSPNEDPVGSVTFGWLTRAGPDTSAQIELTFGELGNSEREEIRLDGSVDRRF